MDNTCSYNCLAWIRLPCWWAASAIWKKVLAWEFFWFTVIFEFLSIIRYLLPDISDWRVFKKIAIFYKLAKWLSFYTRYWGERPWSEVAQSFQSDVVGIWHAQFQDPVQSLFLGLRSILIDWWIEWMPNDCCNWIVLLSVSFGWMPLILTVNYA